MPPVVSSAAAHAARTRPSLRGGGSRGRLHDWHRQSIRQSGSNLSADCAIRYNRIMTATLGLPEAVPVRVVCQTLSISRQRVRRFSVDDLVAYCTVFDLPLEFFFIPPPGKDGADPDFRLLRLIRGSALPTMNRVLELMGAPPDDATEAEKDEWRNRVRALTTPNPWRQGEVLP